MKRVLVLVLLITAAAPAFSQSGSYGNGNGTIVETKTEGNIKWTVRKHIQRVKIGYELNGSYNIEIYDKPTASVFYSDYYDTPPSLKNGKLVGTIKKDAVVDFIDVTQVAQAILEKKYYIFLNVKTDKNVTGWVFLQAGDYKTKSDPDYQNYYNSVPYCDDKWEVLETFTIREKRWTARKLQSPSNNFAVYEILNIRDKPGLIDTKVISQIIPSQINSEPVWVGYTAMTEENETID